ncbi:MAG: TrbC/VirB2 family protein [Rhodospirillaceae bacterium]|nr:TrbC/VirB2 family protein [Rhodospirillaceae bacterium]
MERFRFSAAVFLIVLMASAEAFAAGSNMPWEQPMQAVLDSVQGPIVRTGVVIAIILAGLSLAFGEMSSGWRRGIQIIFGAAIAFTASSFFLSFFSFGGGALL